MVCRSLKKTIPGYSLTSQGSPAVLLLRGAWCPAIGMPPLLIVAQWCGVKEMACSWYTCELWPLARASVLESRVEGRTIRLLQMGGRIKAQGGWSGLRAFLELGLSSSIQAMSTGCLRIAPSWNKTEIKRPFGKWFP